MAGMPDVLASLPLLETFYNPRPKVPSAGPNCGPPYLNDWCPFAP